ncbi:MAG: hypothetical protein WBP46_14815 [Thiolinea sp.]
MLNSLIQGGLLFSLLGLAPAYAELSISSSNLAEGQPAAASASIKITVHIPVRATLKLNANFKQIQTETNLRNPQALIVTCNNQRGLPLANCSEPQVGQIYTLTTL